MENDIHIRQESGGSTDLSLYEILAIAIGGFVIVTVCSVFAIYKCVKYRNRRRDPVT